LDLLWRASLFLPKDSQALQGEALFFQALKAAPGPPPLQQAFHEYHGLQCGFCTPGMFNMAVDFLRMNSAPTRDEIREAVSAVICRCTGCRNIVDAIDAAAKIMRTQSATHDGVSASARQDFSVKSADRSTGLSATKD
jgi:xanthine dehydrogenase iron-sulfur cluster and FAD-binding subunit A